MSTTLEVTCGIILHLCAVGPAGSTQPFDVPTPALLDKDGATLDTMPAIKERWVSHFAGVEGGVPTTATGIVDRIIFAEQSRAGVSYDGDFTCLPTLGGIGKAIAGTKPRSAPGPDGVGPGIYRAQKASTWSSVQLHALAVKPTCTLRSPLQSRGGGLFSLWKRSATALECKNHRAILLGNSDSKVVAKAERNVIPTAAFDTISHEFLTQCGGLKGRGTDIANLAVRCVFATRKIRSRSGISTYVDIFTAFFLR